MVGKLLKLLAQLSSWVDETPPLEQPHQRFGNKAFKAWWERVRDVRELYLNV